MSLWDRGQVEFFRKKGAFLTLKMVILGEKKIFIFLISPESYR